MLVVRVVGTVRSGTTVVAKALETVPGAFAVGESERLWTVPDLTAQVCSCLRQLAGCPRWAPILSELLGPPAHWNATRSASAADPSDVVGALYDRLARAAGASTLIDTSKDPGYVMRAAAASPHPTYLVHVVRDPRGVLFSRLRGWHGEVEHPRPDAWTLLKVAASWRRRNRAFRRMVRRSDRSVTVRYEDFCTAPEQTVRRLATAMGLTVDEQTWSAGDVARVDAGHMAFGNPGRAAVGDLILREDDRWKEGLAGGWRRAMLLACLPTAWRFGYRH